MKNKQLARFDIEHLQKVGFLGDKPIPRSQAPEKLSGQFICPYCGTRKIVEVHDLPHTGILTCYHIGIEDGCGLDYAYRYTILDLLYDNIGGLLVVTEVSTLPGLDQDGSKVADAKERETAKRADSFNRKFRHSSREVPF